MLLLSDEKPVIQLFSIFELRHVLILIWKNRHLESRALKMVKTEIHKRWQNMYFPGHMVKNQGGKIRPVWTELS